jgi:hypothetical protein
MAAQLVIFPASFRTWSFVSVFARARHWILFWARLIQCTLSQLISLRFILIKRFLILCFDWNQYQSELIHPVCSFVSFLYGKFGISHDSVQTAAELECHHRYVSLPMASYKSCDLQWLVTVEQRVGVLSVVSSHAKFMRDRKSPRTYFSSYMLQWT